MAERFTHLDAAGRAHMVDVTAKPETTRTATASAAVVISSQAGMSIETATAARFAGVLAAHRTALLIPLCHTIPLDHVDVEIEPIADTAVLTALVQSTGRTGVEMEALTAVTCAALSVAQSCIASGIDCSINEVAVIHKSGGKSGDWGRTAL